MFPINHPLIQIRVPIGIVEGVRAAVAVCRPHILSKPTEEIPENFADPILQRTAKEYREKTVYSRVPRHIRAFAIRADPNASEEERSEANSAIVSLLSYCGTHWKVYVDTILLKRRNHGFPLRCLCCGEGTRWVQKSGLRVLQRDGTPHQFCKKFTASVQPSMTKMLSDLPKLATAWSRVRKSYDVEETTDFQQREEARKLAEDLGFV